MKYLKACGFVLPFLLTLLLTACTEEKTEVPKDVLSQKATPQGKIPVTILVKYAFSINAFEKAVESKFPNIDIIQVGNYTRDMGIVEYTRRLEHDDLPDIVMTWPLEVGREHWEKRLLDLSSMPFTSRYNTAILDRIASDGKLFYLPGPAQVRGIVYNKTLFEEKGWKVPKDFAGFIALCKQIEASGMRSLQLGFGNPEVLDTAFIGYSYGPSFSTPADAQWLADYNAGKGSFNDHFSPALDTFQAMIKAGIWKKSDLKVTYAEREFMLFNRRCAMVEDSVLIARMGEEINGTKDEFALMPFFNPGTPSDWARIYMVCYIGLNKHLAAQESKEKYNLVLQLMDYISTPEGQAALMADTGAMFSSLKSVEAPALPEIENIRSTLNHGRYASFPELKHAQGALRQGLAALLAGDVSRDDIGNLVDWQNRNPSSLSAATVIGNAAADFSYIETGNFITDVMRAKSGADVALFLDNGKDGRFNGKGVSARFYKGPLTMEDVLRVLPDTKQHEKGILQVVQMTGANLVRTLEHSMAVNNNQRGWFYYFSGLRMEYDPMAEPGTRIKKITTSDGKAIDPAKTYSVAAMDMTLPQEAILSLKETHFSILDLLVEAIKTPQNIAPSGDGRFILPMIKGK